MTPMMQHSAPGILLTIGLLVGSSSADVLALPDSEWVIEKKTLWTESHVLLQDSDKGLEGSNLKILPADVGTGLWIVQSHALYLKGDVNLLTIDLPDNLASSQITAAVNTPDGSLVVASENQIWKLDISESREVHWTQPIPALPSGFRCVDLFQTRQGLIWARSQETLFHLDPGTLPLEWQMVSGSPMGVAIKSGIACGMGEDSNGRFWVTGFKGARIGFWIWDNELENWREIPLPYKPASDGTGARSGQIQQTPVVASSSNQRVDPVLLWEGSIYRWTDGVWVNLGAGSWMNPTMATLSDEPNILWVWDQAEQGTLFRKDLNSGSVDSRVIGKRFSKGFPTILESIPSGDSLYLGASHFLTEIHPDSGAIYKWTASGSKVLPATLKRTGDLKWAAIAENRKGLTEFSWNQSTPDISSSLTTRPLLHWNSEGIRLNSFIHWHGNYWLGTNRGLVVHSENASLNQSPPDSSQSAPPLPEPNLKFALMRPSGIRRDSGLLSASLLKMGSIPEAGFWALTDEGKLVWVWTQPDLENPGWTESVSPWNWSRDAFVKAFSPTKAWIVDSGKWWQVEARYSFVAEDWAWSRIPVNSQLDWNSIPDQLELMEEGWIWTDSRGMGRLSLDGRLSDWSPWQNADPQLAWAEDFTTCFTFQSWDQPQGWFLAGNQMFSFDGTDSFQKGQIIGGSARSRTFLDASSSLQSNGDQRHQILILEPDRLVNWSLLTSGEGKAEGLMLMTQSDELLTDPVLSSSEVVDQDQSENNSSGMVVMSLAGLLIGGSVFYYLRRQRIKESGGLLKAARLKKQQLEKENETDGAEPDPPLDLHRKLPINEAEEETYWSVLGHELRTPLNAILGYAEMMEDEIKSTEDPTQRQDLERIIQATLREMTLIRAALDYTSGESRNIKIIPGSMTRTSIQKSVTRAISNVASVSFNKKCKIQFQQPETSEGGNHLDKAEVEAPVELGRAIEYFLEACLHADPGGNFHFEVSEKGDDLSDPDDSTPKISEVRNPVIRVWGCRWPTRSENLRSWLAEPDPWRALLTQTLPRQGGTGGVDEKIVGDKETPLWKVCLALSQTLARRLGGCLEMPFHPEVNEKDQAMEMHIRVFD